MASKKKQKRGLLSRAKSSVKSSVKSTAKRLLKRVKISSRKHLKHKLRGKSSKKIGKNSRTGRRGRTGRTGRIGRGLFGFIEDTTRGSCSTPVKKCSDENTNCRNYYYLDKDNDIYRPCRNPKKKYDQCRPTASTYNYKCLEGREQEYKSQMEMLDERLELEKKQDHLDSEIRSRIGNIYGTNVRNTSLRNLQMHVSSFPSRNIAKDYPEVDFTKFNEEFAGQVTENINREIDKEIEANRVIIADDQNLPYLYNVLKDAEIYKQLVEKFDTMYRSDRTKFLDKFGNKKVIEQMERRQKRQEQRAIEDRKRIAEQARLKAEQEKLEKEEEKLYMEADLQKPYSPQGSIRDEPGLGVKKSSITTENVKSGDSSKKSIISPPSSVSTVVSQYSLHGNKL